MLALVVERPENGQPNDAVAGPNPLVRAQGPAPDQHQRHCGLCTEVRIPFSVLPAGTFPQRLRKARIQEGFRQAELAREAGVSKDLIYRWERRLHGPRRGMLQRVAWVLGVTGEYLVTGAVIAGVRRAA